MIRAYACRREDLHRSGPAGFTLVELLTVVAILALLISMLLPAMTSAMEAAKMSNCAGVLKNIGHALNQYVSDNHEYLPPATYMDMKAYNYLLKIDIPNGYGGVWHPTYQSYYHYQNLIAPYLGLGNCMPGEDDPYWPQANKWAAAGFSQYKEFQCPSGRNMKSPYGYACDAVNGGSTSGFYMQNCGWTSQTDRIGGAGWPEHMAYFPAFTDVSKAILLYEYWSCNSMTGDSEAAAQPYTTHYKYGPQGPEGAGRTTLYADWHVGVIPPGWDGRETLFGWNGFNCIQRGNEMGIKFKDQWFGKDWVQWVPMLYLTSRG